MQSILIVEDDVIINGGIKIYLEKQNYCVASAFSAAEARNMLENNYSLIILDINLPDENGLELCSEIRRLSAVPIIFLTANDTDENMLDGFNHGCDDYISKPFSVEILSSRIKAVLRRSISPSNNNDLFLFKELKVDFNRMQAYIKEQPVKLSVTEYKILEFLIKNKGQVLTREAILEKIWDIDGNFIDENTLSVHIKRLRQKLGEDSKDPQYILTVFGIGYTFGD